MIAITLIVQFLFWTTTTAHADIIVTLEQVGGPAVAVPGQQTLIDALLKVQLTGNTTLDTSGFQTVMSWSVAQGSASAEDLYTVDTSGDPIIGAAALDAESSGYLYATVPPLFVDVNVNSLDESYQRFLGIVNFNSPVESVSLLQSAVATIAKVRLAVAPNVSDVTFSASFSGSSPSGFLLADGATYQDFTSGGGTIQVVPEPQLIAPLVLLGSLAFISRRLMPVS